ncbi:MAG: LexA family transcriptional regulator [Novosphingobium sp.]|nr:LexA family transcriptional regulator [Novosphingobium sp.]
MPDTDPRERLLQLAGQRGISLSRLSGLIGRNSSYLQQFVRKGSPRKLEETDRRTLARFFGVEESQLGAPEEFSSSREVNTRGGEWVDVPRLAVGASAGPGAIDADERAIGAFRFSARWLREQGLDAANLSAISVQGDSMEPTLRDGDEILVDCRTGPLRDGIHVVRLDEAVLVKRIDTGLPGRIVLMSDNSTYRPIELEAGEVEVVGRVVWKSGRM